MSAGLSESVCERSRSPVWLMARPDGVREVNHPGHRCWKAWAVLLASLSLSLGSATCGGANAENPYADESAEQASEDYGEEMEREMEDR